jgi:hypothetical protein
LKRLLNHKHNSIEASVGDIIQHKENGKIVRFTLLNIGVQKSLKIGYMPPHPSIFFSKENYFVNMGIILVLKLVRIMNDYSIFFEKPA